MNIKPSEGYVLEFNSIYKLENGDILELEKVIELLESKEYRIDPVLEGEKKVYLLRKIN